MIDTPARRREIIEILYFADDYVKIRPLAVRFGVSYATIRNDVDVLSLSYRISSQTGPNGGIKLETKRKNLRFLDPDETAALLRIMYIVPEEERVPGKPQWAVWQTRIVAGKTIMIRQRPPASEGVTEPEL